ncbi:MAG: flagellar basal body-associated FliL family protein [Candidatus Sumerlaeota bacterium]|nr:flagellar basal body-associated FliL family protein [Candidatus Sumerlaeota bacterium]
MGKNHSKSGKRWFARLLLACCYCAVPLCPLALAGNETKPPAGKDAKPPAAKETPRAAQKGTTNTLKLADQEAMSRNASRFEMVGLMDNGTTRTAANDEILSNTAITTAARAALEAADFENVYRSWDDKRTTEAQAMEERKPVRVHPDLLNWDAKRAVLVAMGEHRLQLQTAVPRFLILDYTVELSRASAGEELQQNKTTMKEKALLILQSVSYERLRTIEGKLTIKRQLLREINKILKTGAAREVYFATFNIVEPF